MPQIWTSKSNTSDFTIIIKKDQMKEMCCDVTQLIYGRCFLKSSHILTPFVCSSSLTHLSSVTLYRPHVSDWTIDATLKTASTNAVFLMVIIGRMILA